MFGDALLAQRPTNAMHQLGIRSRVPLFNARALLGALAGTRAVLWMARIDHPAAGLGVLRAASHLKAAVGFCLGPGGRDPSAFRHQARPGGQLHLLARAAEELDPAPPFALHLELPAVADSDGPAAIAARDLVADCVQAGFTSFGIDLRSCPDGQRAALAAELMRPALDLELTVCVRLPTGPGQPDPAAALGALAAAGVPVDLAVLPGPTELGTAAWALAKVLSDRLAPVRVAWSELPRSRTGPPPPVAALVGDPFLERLFPGGPDVGADPDRVEALAYAEALARIERLGGKNSLFAVVAHLESLCG